MAHDVFISYSHEDQAIANAVCHRMEAAGVRCWIAPRDVQIGVEWDDAIVAAVSASRIFVLIFSAAANNSRAVRNEIVTAANANLIIFPFRIEAVAPSGGLQFHLSRLHWLDALTPPVEAHIDLLTERAKRVLGVADAEARPTGAVTAPTAAQAPASARDVRLGFHLIDDFLGLLTHPRKFMLAAMDTPVEEPLWNPLLFFLVSEIMTIFINSIALESGTQPAELLQRFFFSLAGTFISAFILRLAWVGTKISLRACIIYSCYALTSLELICAFLTYFGMALLKVLDRRFFDTAIEILKRPASFLEFGAIAKTYSTYDLTIYLIFFLMEIIAYAVTLAYLLISWGALRRLAEVSLLRSSLALSIFVIVCVPYLLLLGIIAEAMLMSR
jgi:hypothetical protein